MCVWLPSWPLQKMNYEQPEHRKRTLVLYADSGPNGLRVVTCCQRAAECGVVPGIPLAEAQGLLSTSRRSQSHEPRFVRHEPSDDQTALNKLAGWCQRFGPVVGVEEPDSLLLDVTGRKVPESSTGCVHLFGGERRLSRQVEQDFRRWGFFVRVAIADTIGAAWAAATLRNNRRP